MNEMQVFPSEEFGEIRTVLIKGTEYFFGVDVAKALQYKRARKAVTDNCKGVLTEDTLKNKGNYPELLIPIGDVYRLIVKASSQSNSEDIKEKAGRFERLIFDEILPQIHKTGSYGTPQTLQGQIQLLAQGTDELYQKVDALDKKLETALLELPLLGVESDKVDKALKHRGVEVVGGKESNAYHDKRLLKRVYWDIHGQLRREFQVGTYKAIKRNQTDLALKFIAEYQLPLALREEIEAANAQQWLDV